MVQFILQVNSSIQNEDLQLCRNYIQWSGEMNHYMFLDMGLEHYKLLSFLSKQFPDGTTIYDIGTHHGASSLSLTANPTIKVITYDIVNHIPGNVPSIYTHSQIECRIANCLDEPHISELLNAPFIFFDIAPHNGEDETRFFNCLKDKQYEGIVLFDDIFLNPEMRYFWENNIPTDIKKIDLTKYGHRYGSGAVIFNPSKYDLQINE